MKKCTNCGSNNEDNNQFCLNCGKRLPNLPVQPAIVRQPMPNQPQSINPQRRPVAPPLPPSLGAMPPINYPAGAGQVNPSAFSQASSSNSASIWTPFAGLGKKNKHEGWLMDGKGHFAEDLVQKVTQKFSERQIPGAKVEKRILQTRGVLVEKRPYFMISSQQNSAALYITQYGKDLFISLTTFLKSNISKARLIVLSGVGFIWFITTLILVISFVGLSAYLQSLGSMDFLFSDSSPSVPIETILLGVCASGPANLLTSLMLTVFAGFSFYKFLSEKDFLALLRARPDEFLEDDLMALEKAVEQTVKISIDEIGLDPNDLKPINIGTKHRII